MNKISIIKMWIICQAVKEMFLFLVPHGAVYCGALICWEVLGKYFGKKLLSRRSAVCLL